MGLEAAGTRRPELTCFVEQVSSLTYITKHGAETRPLPPSRGCCLHLTSGRSGAGRAEGRGGHDLAQRGSRAPVTFSCECRLTLARPCARRCPKPHLPVSSSLSQRTCRFLQGQALRTRTAQSAPPLVFLVMTSGNAVRVPRATCSWSELRGTKKKDPKKSSVLHIHPILDRG